MGSLLKRWTAHKAESKRGNMKPLYVAMREDNIENFISKQGFRSTLERSYTHIPHYSKTKKCWLLKGEPTDINNYNPVSTILESEE